MHAIHYPKSRDRYNADRISGLETQPCLLIFNAYTKKLHLVAGFKLKNNDACERGIPAQEAIVEWIGILAPTSDSLAVAEYAQRQNAAAMEAAKAASRAGAAGSRPRSTSRGTSQQFPDLSSLLSREAMTEYDWINDIWQGLLAPYVGYYSLDLTQVYSIFKRRHELKYTALEVIDLCGYSLLFSCESINTTTTLLSDMLEIEMPSSIFQRVLGSKSIKMLRGVR